MSETALEIIYNGFRQYILNYKGHLTCTPIEEIKQWEAWKKMVFDEGDKKKKEAKNGRMV